MSQRQSPKVFIVVLNWNGWRDTVECLESLQRLEYPNFRIVVVDNGSSDGSPELIESWAAERQPAKSGFVTCRSGEMPLSLVAYGREEAESGGREGSETVLSSNPCDRSLVLIRTGENLGFSGGCNVGMRYALKRGAGYVWLLNNDTFAHPGALSEMVALARSDKRIGLVGSTLRYFGEPRSTQAYGGGSINWWVGATRYLKGPREGNLDYLTGASLLIRGEVLQSIGLLDESYFFYWEDIAYSQRALRAGWELAVAGNSQILHKEGGTVSAGERVKSFASDRFMVRGMVLFFHEYGGARWPLTVILRLGGIMLNRVRRRQLDRILPLLRVAGSTARERMRRDA